MNTANNIAKGFGVVCAMLISAAQADYVVLQSGSELYPPGTLVSDPRTLELATGTHLLLLSEHGETLSLGGTSEAPDTTQPSEAKFKFLLTNLVSHTQDAHVSLGATRGGTLNGARDDVPLWSIDPLVSGIQCVIEGVAAPAYRSDTRGDLALTVNLPGSDYSGSLNWQAGEHETEWPSEVPIVDGQTYVVRREGWNESSLIQLQSIPKVVIDSQTATVAWLAASNCVPQAITLLHQLE
jgi:hypothetical protein